MVGSPRKVEKNWGKIFREGNLEKDTVGAIMPTSSRITKTEGLHYKVGWNGIGEGAV